MPKVTGRCGCGREMTPDVLRGPGGLRCGCGVRVQVTAEALQRRPTCPVQDCAGELSPHALIPACRDHWRRIMRLIDNENLAAAYKRLLIDGHRPVEWDAIVDLGGQYAAGLERALSYLPDPEAPATVVYFIRSGEYIKIGMSRDVHSRIVQLQWPAPPEVLLTVPGGRTEERQMHALFKRHQSHGEWFHAHTDILEFIDSLKAAA